MLQGVVCSGRHLVGGGVRGRQLPLVVQHLLKVGNMPPCVSGVSVEALRKGKGGGSTQKDVWLCVAEQSFVKEARSLALLMHASHRCASFDMQFHRTVLSTDLVTCSVATSE